ncbi:unnamed protein product [Owenia fusiformis]|uniref:N-acetylneuraminate lyase n=1 Tax=Owenia fusiformis TaxID=6347 RepID=A0A8J1U4F4_OWEFU|nr:unnamed protein product [Owenia fusiformis]
MSTEKKTVKDFKIEGNILAPFTPFKENGDVDLEIIPKYVDLILKYNIPNVFVLGTTGEGATLTVEERKQVTEAWARAVDNKPLTIIAHVGGANLRESMDLASHAETVDGVQAIAATGSVYYKPKTEDVEVDYIKQIAAEAPSLPFFYYDIDFMTGIKLNVSSLAQLATKVIPTFRGIKHSSKSIASMVNCSMIGGVQVINGAVDQYLAALTCGMEWPVLGVPCTAPIATKIKEAYDQGDMKTAREQQEYLQRLYNLRDSVGGGNGVLRAIVKLIDGIDFGRSRCPIPYPTQDNIDTLKQGLIDLEFL